MENNDLRIFWQKLHTDADEQNINFKEIIHKKHCNMISKMLLRQKKNVWLFALTSSISLLFAIWDMAIMGSENVYLWSSTAFLIYCAISSHNKYQLLTKTADLSSIKQSTFILKKRLERMIKVDFIICLLFFYGITARIMMIMVDNSENLSNIKSILWVFIPILIIIPWLIRYLNKQQYKHYLASLEKSISFLESN